MDVVVVISVFAVVQSIFGVGLLVFGTPTLLLLGHPFNETLGALLPASIAISLLQLRGARLPDRIFLRQFGAWCLVPLAIALALVLRSGVSVNLNLAVAAALAVFAVVRTSARVRKRAAPWVSRHTRAWLTLTGLVHGFSNLGGGPLLILAASRYRQKEAMRPFIALCYASFAAIQLGVLAFLIPAVFGWHQLVNASVSASVFLFAGQRFFGWVPAQRFELLLTVLVAAYAAILGLRGFGVI